MINSRIHNSKDGSNDIVDKMNCSSKNIKNYEQLRDYITVHEILDKIGRQQNSMWLRNLEAAGAIKQLRGAVFEIF